MPSTLVIVVINQLSWLWGPHIVGPIPTQDFLMGFPRGKSQETLVRRSRPSASVKQLVAQYPESWEVATEPWSLDGVSYMANPQRNIKTIKGYGLYMGNRMGHENGKR